jgi:dCMP deaminase
VHAEQNAIVQAATSGVNLEGATLYSTTHPCILCSKLVINARVKKVIYLEGYPDQLAKEMLDEAGIVVERFDSGQKQKAEESRNF